MAEQNTDPDFDLEKFLPYMLNQAAEATSHSFEAVYRSLYGMTRTQWRVMANLGKFGAMTARDICVISHIEKTKVSRAVSALENQDMLSRTPSAEDGRAEILSLTKKGQMAFGDLGRRALDYDRKLRADLGEQVSSELARSLERLMKI
ncbi:winged helix-turn-helix transcriptional regulator [Rhizobium lentis]|uniref:MarR family winged helix-turn-helix transcriptional regulator n=1 Tax=Rhizobium lentis TaxID=1138194 RepID=UPI001C83F376|nr:MarR family winged helix-turn-helix transcriptional regulator [Rhizobium lentis]MBX5041290.1 winged helix-turn-helix transcriptional regulator [Rhizobium lentis]MBX5071546.1 winged helix-turn-helix transcriptional regulator [Rhizobium lentis]MBX5108416.1 winged helix-turn-helix transcriptional regulator [Rhizobium lentis]MBX5117348.1 winged helix-turn-helix transcriptional regulator [Rhizobium lentis]MBX5179022.1 winged helix-turn-helix transcriptional regulator [Rhizobium lentis]